MVDGQLICMIEENVPLIAGDDERNGYHHHQTPVTAANLTATFHTLCWNSSFRNSSTHFLMEWP